MTRRPRFVPEPAPSYPEPRTALQAAQHDLATHADRHTGAAVWPDRCPTCRDLLERVMRERVRELAVRP